MQRTKLCICLIGIFLIGIVPGASGAVEEQPLEDSMLMLNKYSPYQEVTYHVKDLTVVDSQVCTHGDPTALDLQYSGIMEKTVRTDDAEASVVSTKPFAGWACQSELLERSCADK